MMRLFCLPYAGGRETIFRRWQTAMPAAIEVCPIELPGHGRRIAEPLCCDLDTMVAAVASTIAGKLDAPFALFGHSMGALVAFELSRRLQSRVGPRPLVLYVSGRRAPQIVDVRLPWYTLPRDRFFAAWRRLNGMPMPALDNPRVGAVMEPILRADCQAVQTYRFVRGDRLECPIVAFGGTDDPHCGRVELELWREQTAAGFTARMLPGGHFFIESHRDEFLRRCPRT